MEKSEEASWHIGVTIALRGDLDLIEDHEDSSTRKTVSESIAATI